ncbi:hypothetical protein [Isobaculum melis]|uniref:Lipoprotein n=1 Tax=Isobaculum melis TaxID=142588 RepID=A0A1H9RS68_9LACT|nr:hypothetical protein [Isobaculum melis]SER75497.1 hypothetical protein SAMN04488559_10533 [Isobaculum melis]
MKNLKKITVILLCGMVLSACSLSNKEDKKSKNDESTTSEKKEKDATKITIKDGDELETVEYVLPTEYKNIEWLNKSGDLLYFLSYDQEDYNKSTLVRYNVKDKSTKVLETLEKGNDFSRRNFILTDQVFIWTTSNDAANTMKIKYMLNGKEDIKEAFPGKQIEKYTSTGLIENQIVISYYEDEHHIFYENIDTGEVKEGDKELGELLSAAYNYNRTALITSDYQKNKQLTVISDLTDDEEYIVNPPLKKRDYDYMDNYLVGMDYLFQITELTDDDENETRFFITDIKTNKSIELEKDFLDDDKYMYHIASNSRYFVLSKNDYQKSDIGFYELKKNKLIKHTIDKDYGNIADLYVSTDDEILFLTSERNEAFEREYKLVVVE